MGMHFGVLAAELPARALLERLDAYVPRFLDRGTVSSLRAFDLHEATHDEGWDLAIGELEGKAYLLDPLFLLSGMKPDLIAALAASSGKLVIGCGAETVSGTFYCVVARGDEVLRHYFQCNSTLAEP
jgi:hypothetical protein